MVFHRINEAKSSVTMKNIKLTIDAPETVCVVLSTIFYTGTVSGNTDSKSVCRGTMNLYDSSYDAIIKSINQHSWCQGGGGHWFQRFHWNTITHKINRVSQASTALCIPDYKHN